MEKVYFTLPSNVPSIKGSSNKNTPNDYRTLLPQPFELDSRENYEVGLSEISFPQNFSESLSISECSFEFAERRLSRALQRWMEEKRDELTQKVSLTEVQNRQLIEYQAALSSYIAETNPRQSNARRKRTKTAFANTSELVTWLNDIRPRGMNMFGIDSEDGKVKISLGKYEYVQFSNNRLAKALGYQSTIVTGKGDNANIADGKDATTGGSSTVDGAEENNDGEDDLSLSNDNADVASHDVRIQRLYDGYVRYLRLKGGRTRYRPRTIKAPNLPLLRNVCYNLFVYTNLVRESLVGNVNVPLIRTIPIDHDQDGKYIGRYYEKERFLPLASNFYEYIDIKITDDMGRDIEFKSGKVIVTLCVQRKRI